MEDTAVQEQPQTQEQPKFQSSNDWLNDVNQREFEPDPKELENDPSLSQPLKEAPKQNEKFDASQVALQTEPEQKEIVIKTWDGKDKPVTLDWFKGYFGIKGNEELAKHVTEENAPLLAAIAEKTLKLNNLVQQASVIKPEYETYKQGVDNYFGAIAQDPIKGFDKILSDLNMTEQQKDVMYEKMLIEYVNKKDMSPEQRAAIEAKNERDRIIAEKESVQRELEQIKAQQEHDRFVQENSGNYAKAIPLALQNAGFNVTDTAKDALIEEVQNYLSRYPQSTPITQQQFDFIAKQLAQRTMNLKQTNPIKPPPVATRKFANGNGKSYSGNAQQQPNGKFMTPKQWMENIG